MEEAKEQRSHPWHVALGCDGIHNFRQNNCKHLCCLEKLFPEQQGAFKTHKRDLYKLCNIQCTSVAWVMYLHLLGAQSLFRSVSVLKPPAGPVREAYEST